MKKAKPYDPLDAGTSPPPSKEGMTAHWVDLFVVEEHNPIEVFSVWLKKEYAAVSRFIQYQNGRKEHDLHVTCVPGLRVDSGLSTFYFFNDISYGRIRVDVSEPDENIDKAIWDDILCRATETECAALQRHLAACVRNATKEGK